MTQNLTTIKKELKNCEEINTIYDLTINDNIKFITLKGNEEYFYKGIYTKMGNNKIFVNTDGSIKPFKLKHQNSDGSTFYKTRIFIEKTKCEKNNEEYQKIINTQQMIIEKMNLQLKKQNQIIKHLHEKLTEN